MGREPAALQGRNPVGVTSLLKIADVALEGAAGNTIVTLCP